MSKTGIISIMGDIHGEINILSNYITKHKPALTIQLGDFGYWPGYRKFSQIQEIKEPVWFIDGNHENHFALNLAQEPLFPNCGVQYIKRGTIRDLPNGERALFMGGAASIDKDKRTPGFDWFPQEVISEKDIVDLPDESIDIIFSHTCPDCIKNQIIKKCNGNDSFKDPSTTWLQVIMDKYKPTRWFFSHWHTSHELTYAGVYFSCLDINEVKEI